MNRKHIRALLLTLVLLLSLTLLIPSARADFGDAFIDCGDFLRRERVLAFLLRKDPRLEDAEPAQEEI